MRAIPLKAATTAPGSRAATARELALENTRAVTSNASRFSAT